MLLFEVVLFHPRLSFLRSDVDEGVAGSSGLDSCVGVLLFGAFPTF
jgi:hypothetical protein